VTAALLTGTLEDELAGLRRGAASACLVCGEDVELRAGRAECAACGSVLAAENDRAVRQLASA
jgi:hypothetical protein